METFQKIWELGLINIAGYDISIHKILVIFLIIVVTKIIIWAIRKLLFRKHKQGKIDYGNIHSIFQIIRYVLWVIALSYMLETIGISLTVLLAGGAALLVGIGLGLQQTFNDLISGIILLSERTIKIGDILEIDGDVIKIQKIGLRTSVGLNRDEISIIIPNSRITTNKVINWSHQSMKTRFNINVGVAYGSDVTLVMKILEESTLEHLDISDRDLIEVRLIEFGNSSLDFQILFFSNNIFKIEMVKSDIRKIIHQKFIENNISIPFPQMDVHLNQSENKAKSTK